MNYNSGNARRNFYAKWDKLREEYRAAGMKEDATTSWAKRSTAKLCGTSWKRGRADRIPSGRLSCGA